MLDYSALSLWLFLWHKIRCFFLEPGIIFLGCENGNVATHSVMPKATQLGTGYFHRGIWSGLYLRVSGFSQLCEHLLEQDAPFGSNDCAILPHVILHSDQGSQAGIVAFSQSIRFGELCPDLGRRFNG